MPTKYPHGRLPSSSGAKSLRWRAKESRQLEARGMTTTSRRRPEPGEPGDESGSPREDRGRDGLHRGNRAGDRDRAGRGGRVGRGERADAGAREGRDRADPANRGRRTGPGGGGGPGTASGVEPFVCEVPEADVLVNNLGIFEAKPVGEIPDADRMRLSRSTCLA